MGTRSNIGILNLDGSYDVIYCHWDGYPSDNGRILYEHYQDLKKIKQLLALGDLSSLGEEIGKKHPFDTIRMTEAQRKVYEKKYGKMCTVYARDRGETGIIKTMMSYAPCLKRHGRNGCISTVWKTANGITRNFLPAERIEPYQVHCTSLRLVLLSVGEACVVVPSYLHQVTACTAKRLLPLACKLGAGKVDQADHLYCRALHLVAAYFLQDNVAH